MDQSFETHISHVFDAYCKKVLRNELRNIHKQYAYVRDWIGYNKLDRKDKVCKL